MESLLASGLQDAIEALCAAAGHDRLVFVAANDGEVRFECCSLSRETRFSDVPQFPSVLA